jgi:hypothetical protein
MGFSDLTGQMAEETQLGRLVVLEHPELAEDRFWSKPFQRRWRRSRVYPSRR